MRTPRPLIALAIACIASASAVALTDKEIVNSQSPAVVYIKTDIGSGTGFFINEFGSIVTCYHVVEGAKSIQIKWQTGFLDVELANAFPEQDQAILQAKLTGTPYVAVEPLKKAQDGKAAPIVELTDQLLVMGHPLGIEQLNVNLGKVSAVYPDPKIDYIYQSDVVVNPGNSGGPAFNRDGRVVGAVTSKIDSSKMTNVAGMSYINALVVANDRWADYCQSLAPDDRRKTLVTGQWTGGPRLMKFSLWAINGVETYTVRYFDESTSVDPDFKIIERHPLSYADRFAITLWNAAIYYVDPAKIIFKLENGDSLIAGTGKDGKLKFVAGPIAEASIRKTKPPRILWETGLVKFDKVTITRFSANETDQLKARVADLEKELRARIVENRARKKKTADLVYAVHTAKNPILRQAMTEAYLDYTASWDPTTESEALGKF